MQRCRALGQTLVASGVECSFASTPESRTALPDEAQRLFAWIDVARDADARAVGLSAGGSADWLVVDHYGLDYTFERAARSWAQQVMVIDDLPRPHDCDLLLDQNQNDEKRWCGLVSAEAKVLAGPRYALLRRDICDAIVARPEPQPRAIMVFGAADPRRLTERLLPAVAKALPSSWALDVITGPVNMRHEKLREMCKSLNAAFYHAPRDIAAKFARSRLAVTAGGSTCWEFAALGVPMVIVIDSNDQEIVGVTAANAGAGVSVGSSEDNVDARVAQAVSDLIEDRQRLRAMSLAGRKLVDGQGPRRVADAMLNSVAKNEVAG